MAREYLWSVLFAILATALFLLLLGPRLAHAGGTVTFTDEAGEPAATEPLPADGRLLFRIKAAARVLGDGGVPLDLPTEAVLVADGSGQMQTACYPISNGQEISVTSEVVAAVAPVVTITGRAFSAPDCSGPGSPQSNPITVEFVPEAPALLGPTQP